MYRILMVAAAAACGVLLFPHTMMGQPARDETTPSALAETVRDPFVRALYRHMPLLRFDEEERFFPLRARSMTNNPGNRLARENGVTLARRNADGTGLNLGYLRGIPPGYYPHINDAILDRDMLDAEGDDLATYRTHAQRMQNDRKFRDRIYGRVVRHYEQGVLAGAWLQYWFFYYFNDFPLPTDAGHHEGDWEMVQVFVDVNVKPQVAVYAHHGQHTYCRWDRMTTTQSRPVVYVARGSHASYFRSGEHGQDRYNSGTRTRPLKLIRVAQNRPQWLNWPGFWGASIDGQFRSPRGPRQQGIWSRPHEFYSNAALDGDCD